MNWWIEDQMGEQGKSNMPPPFFHSLVFETYLNDVSFTNKLAKNELGFKFDLSQIYFD